MNFIPSSSCRDDPCTSFEEIICIIFAALELSLTLLLGLRRLQLGSIENFGGSGCENSDRNDNCPSINKAMLFYIGLNVAVSRQLYCFLKCFVHHQTSYTRFRDHLFKFEVISGHRL